jgi:CHAT domain-containing protein/Tfp pilus assembly protein PilF
VTRRILAVIFVPLAVAMTISPALIQGADSLLRAEITKPSSSPLDSQPGSESASILADLRSGRNAEAISACLGIIERNPSAMSAYAWLFQALEEMPVSARAAAVLMATQRIERLLQEHPGNVYYHYGLGVAYQKQNKFALAREHLRKSISLGGNFRDVYGELVNCYLTKKDIEDTAAFLLARLKQSPDNAFLHQAIGLVHYYSSEYHAAYASLEKARTIFHETGARGDEGQCLLNLSDVFTYLNDYPSALREAQTGLRISRETGDRILETQCLERSAFVWTDLGKDAEAREACQQALTLAREIVCRRLEVLCLRTWGVIFLERGDLASAQDFLSQALAYYQQTTALRSQDICLYWLTLLYKDKGDYSKAMACATEALRISREIGFKTGEAFHLTTIGDIYRSLGNYERALEFNKEALGVAEQYIGKWSREECLNTIGLVYIELHDYARAMDSFKEALEYIRKIGHRREEARCLYNIGFAYFKLGDLPNAFEFFSKSLSAASLAGKKIIQAQNYNRLGDLYRELGSWDKSKDSYVLAQSVGREIGQPTAIWEAYAGLGALFTARKEFPSAIENYKKAIGIIEDLRVQLLLREYSSGFFKSKIPIYEALVNLLFEGAEKKPSAEALEECLYYAEKAKARSFLDDLQKAKIDSSSLPQEKVDELEQISRKISHLSAELNDGSLSPADGAQFREQLEKAEDDYQLFAERARAENPNYSRAVSSEPCRLPEIRRKLLNGETGIVEYFVGEENIYIFFITAGNLSVRRLTPPESRRTLRLVSNYIRLLSSREITNSDVAPAGRKLYDALFGAAGREYLSGIKNLIFIPDRTLYYLPFETLVPGEEPGSGRTSSRFLMEDYGISYAPSASTLVSILERQERITAEADLLSIGNPSFGRTDDIKRVGKNGNDVLSEYYLEKRFVLHPLEFASREMESISRLMAPGSRRIVSGAEATEDRVKKLPLSGYKILHFATHSLLDEMVASRSALVLSADSQSDEDGFLQAREIYNLKLNADLVVLSACQTAGGKMEKGEGIQGLSRAFFCSGSRAVVASLWNANDESTSYFMKSFYGFLTEGKTKQEGLRLTKIKMCRSDEWRPYHWAAFVLIGEGDAIIPLHRLSFWRRLLHF